MKKLIARVCNGLGTAILVVIVLAAGGLLGLQAAGIKPMAVLSGSMEPAYHVGGLVFINTRVAAAEIEPGDAITFTMGAETVVTHRVVAIGDGAFTTKGDANDIEDLAPVPFENLVGRAAFQIPRAGTALMNLQTRKGFAAGALLAAVLIALFVTPALLTPSKPKKDRGGDDNEA
jgi:signal peptidase